MESIVTTFEQDVNRHLPPGRLLLCVSGGADSMALLHCCRRLNRDFMVVHCDFHLRGEESERDRRFVEHTCTDLGVNLHVEHFDVDTYMHEHGVSIEMACRELRYALFRRLMKDSGCSRIVVAHNSDDDAETMLLNLFRGTGLKGLCGMSTDTGEICRPLLGMSRAAIEKYIRAIGAAYITDSSNLSSDYLRNYIRLELLPSIEKRWPGVRKALQRTRDNLNDARLVCESVPAPPGMTENFLPGEAIRNAVAPAMLIHTFLEGRGASSSQIREMARSDRAGAQWQIPSGRVIRDSKGLHILNTEDSADEQMFEEEVIPFTMEIVARMKSDRKAEEFFCPPEVAPLYRRKPRPGDRMKPYGMKGSKLVSDLIHEAHFSPAERADIYLFTDADDNILWIPGIRRSSLYPVPRNAAEVLHIRRIKKS